MILVGAGKSAEGIKAPTAFAGEAKPKSSAAFRFSTAYCSPPVGNSLPSSLAWHSRPTRSGVPRVRKKSVEIPTALSSRASVRPPGNKLAWELVLLRGPAAALAKATILGSVAARARSASNCGQPIASVAPGNGFCVAVARPGAVKPSRSGSTLCAYCAPSARAKVADTVARAIWTTISEARTRPRREWLPSRPRRASSGLPLARTEHGAMAQIEPPRAPVSMAMARLGNDNKEGSVRSSTAPKLGASAAPSATAHKPERAPANE